MFKSWKLCKLRTPKRRNKYLKMTSLQGSLSIKGKNKNLYSCNFFYFGYKSVSETHMACMRVIILQNLLFHIRNFLVFLFFLCRQRKYYIFVSHIQPEHTCSEVVFPLSRLIGRGKGKGGKKRKFGIPHTERIFSFSLLFIINSNVADVERVL